MRNTDGFKEEHKSSLHLVVNSSDKDPVGNDGSGGIAHPGVGVSVCMREKPAAGR